MSQSNGDDPRSPAAAPFLEGDKLDAAEYGKETLSIDIDFIHEEAARRGEAADTFLMSAPAFADDDADDDPDAALAFGETIAPVGAQRTLATAPGKTRGGFSTLASIAPDHSEDDVILRLGEYDVVGELGQGGMGLVYRGYSRSLGRYVAIKTIRPNLMSSEIASQRFINEAMLAARLNHPNIVQVYGSGETEEGTGYFVMAFVAGRDLGTYLDEGLVSAAGSATATRTSAGTTATPLQDGKLTVRGAVEILEKTARALHFAHLQGVVHRDVKPDNILVDENLQPHVTDFGIAKAIVEDAGITNAGEIMGTPHYMSPEQANGELAAIGPRSDVYSLGATLYHIITGNTLFEGDGMRVVFQVIRDEPRVPTERKLPDLPPISLDLETICLKAIEKNAEKRYESAEAFADELRRYLDGDPIAARPIGAGERFRRRLMKNRRLAVAAFVTVALLFTMAGAFGLTLIATISNTSESIRELDEEQALAESATLVRAVGLNMLQGRADLARDLAHGLEQGNRTIAVARTDKTIAYTDGATRDRVSKLLSDPEHLAKIEKKQPEMLDEIRVLKEVGLARIADAELPGGTIEVDEEAWGEVIGGAQPKVYEDEATNELVVLRPILNQEECEVCHLDTVGYGRVRAVLVVRRSLDEIDAVISDNTRTTWMVGGVTVLALLALLWLTARIFGLGIRQSFGARRSSAPES